MRTLGKAIVWGVGLALGFTVAGLAMLLLGISLFTAAAPTIVQTLVPRATAPAPAPIERPRPRTTVVLPAHPRSPEPAGLNEYLREISTQGGRRTMLPEPIELLDLADQEKQSFRVTRYQQGQITINPVHAPGEKVVDALRVYVFAADKPHGLPYWDITSKTLRAQLLPFLQNNQPGSKRFTITAHGVRPSKRFTVTVE